MDVGEVAFERSGRNAFEHKAFGKRWNRRYVSTCIPKDRYTNLFCSNSVHGLPSSFTSCRLFIPRSYLVRPSANREDRTRPIPANQILIASEAESGEARRGLG